MSRHLGGTAGTYFHNRKITYYCFDFLIVGFFIALGMIISTFAEPGSELVLYLTAAGTVTMFFFGYTSSKRDEEKPPCSIQ